MIPSDTPGLDLIHLSVEGETEIVNLTNREYSTVVTLCYIDYAMFLSLHDLKVVHLSISSWARRVYTMNISHIKLRSHDLREKSQPAHNYHVCTRVP